MIKTETPRGRRASLLRAAVVCGCFVAARCDASLAATAPEWSEQPDSQRPYGFHYAVQDRRTGDTKSQNEVGDGRGGVRGSYSLLEPDGSTRVVEYTADDERGFVARVKWIAPGPEEPPSDGPGATGHDADEHRGVGAARDAPPRPSAAAYEFNVIEHAASDALQQTPSASPLSVHSYDV